MNTIGFRLKEIRNNLNQVKFSKKLEIAQTTYWRYESDDRLPTSDVLLRLIAMGWSATWILTGVGEKRVERSGDSENKVFVGGPGAQCAHITSQIHAVIARLDQPSDEVFSQLIEASASLRKVAAILGNKA